MDLNAGAKTRSAIGDVQDKLQTIFQRVEMLTILLSQVDHRAEFYMTEDAVGGICQVLKTVSNDIKSCDRDLGESIKDRCPSTGGPRNEKSGK